MTNDFDKRRKKFDEDWDKAQHRTKIFAILIILMYAVILLGMGWVVYTLVTWVITK